MVVTVVVVRVGALKVNVLLARSRCLDGDAAGHAFLGVGLEFRNARLGAHGCDGPGPVSCLEILQSFDCTGKTRQVVLL